MCAQQGNSQSGHQGCWGYQLSGLQPGRECGRHRCDSVRNAGNWNVSIVCQAPDGKELLRLPAIVRNRCGFHYGLEFLNVNAEQDRAIREWIKSER